MRGASKDEAVAPSKPGAAEGVLTVSRLAALIRGTLEDHLPRKVRVVGEVSSSRHSTHLYFALKDSGAVLNAAVFASTLRKIGFTPRDGQEVLATGRIEFYEPQGRLTLIVEKLESVGQGAHELRFKQLCDELRTLGWFAAERKRPLPSFPRRVAVITSRTGAALQDVLSTMAKRCPAVSVAIVPVRVQGEASAGEVVRALQYLSRNHTHLGIDAIIVTRGGGSAEDLAAFNDRQVAQAIVECEVPVVAAIGHETDTTIAELVADERCATPTQAAVRLTPDRTALHRQLDTLEGRFRTDLARTLRYERQRLASAARHPVLADPHGATKLASNRLSTLREGLDSAIAASMQSATHRCERSHLGIQRLQPERLLQNARAAVQSHTRHIERAVGSAVASQRAAVSSHTARLEAVGPREVLRRGYSCTIRPDGSIARRASDLTPGDRLTTHLAEGSFDSDIVETSAGTLGETAAPAASKPATTPATPRATHKKTPKPQHSKSPDEPDQLDLFAKGG